MRTPRRFLPSVASLRALEALDRLGSASAAAEELSLTQGAVSRQLQTLESQLGVPLLLREKKRLVLTQAAQSYVMEIREALQQIAQASLRLQVNPQGGTVNLAILPTFGMRWLVPRLADFTKRHPLITVNMSTRLVPFNFGREPFDAAIHFGTAEWPGTDHMLLKSETLVAVCAPGVLQAGALQSASDIQTLPLLHIETRPDAWADWLRQEGVVLAGPVSGTMYDQFATITQAALHGLGLALLPDYLVEQDLATGRLVQAWPGRNPANGAYYLVWPHDKSRNPALMQFRDWLATQTEDEDALPR